MFVRPVAIWRIEQEAEEDVCLYLPLMTNTVVH